MSDDHQHQSGVRGQHQPSQRLLQPRQPDLHQSYFPWTRTNIAIFITNNVTVVSVNLLVLVWLKLKENRAVNEPKVSQCWRRPLLEFRIKNLLGHFPKLQ